MRFVEESDGNFSAAQLAAAERELEEQKKEWERGRLRAMREEEERQMRMTDDDENPLTFTREDAQNQVNNSTSNSRRASSNKRPTRQVRRGRGRRAAAGRVSRKSNRSIEQEETSESESETTSMSETDSEDDVDKIPKRSNSTDEEKDTSSKLGSSDEENNENSEDEDEDDGEDEDDEDSSQSGRRQTNPRNRVLSLSKKNHFDINSPRTRSSGDVKINLWTLDESPILPESKPRKRKRSKNNKSVDKSEDSFTVPSLPDQDSKTRTVSESLDDTSKIMDASTNSSADESTCDEEDVKDTAYNTSISLTSTPKVKTTKRVVQKTILRPNLRSSEKESGASSDMLQSPVVESKLISVKEADTELKASGPEMQSNESKIANSTPHKSPGRPRKTSQSLPTTPLTSEPHVVATYSTRSSNKLPIARPLQDKRTVPPIKINCKGEPVICDNINDTSNTQNEAKEASQKSTAAVTPSTTTASPIKDASIRPNETADNSAMSIDNEETVITDSNEKSTVIIQSEQQESNKTNMEEVNLESDNLSENRSPSPILSVRKIKTRRSYSRIRTDLKDKKQTLSVTPVDLETKPKSVDNSKNKDTQELVHTPTEVDHSPSLKANDDAALSSTKSVSPHRSSPLPRPTKMTRSTVRSITDSTESPVISKTEIEAKSKAIVPEVKPDECKYLEKAKSSEIASSLPVAAETNTNTTRIIKEDKNQAPQVKCKLTRSSARSISEVKEIKSKEKMGGITSETTNEQTKPNTEKCKDLETTLSVATVDSKVKPTQKSECEEEQPQAPVKLTRSIARSISESQSKVSKVSSTADTVVAEPVKTTVEKSKTEENITMPEKEATVEAISKRSKVSEKEKSLEAENVTTTVSEEEKGPKAVKDIIENKIIKEQQSITPAPDSKNSTVDSPVLLSPEPKTKASKSETPVIGVTTRRSRANYNVDVAPEISTVAAVSTVTTEKVIPSKKLDEPQNKTVSVAESQPEKSANQNADASFEQPKVTKSNMQVPNPMCRRLPSPTKVAALRRRPDTPMPTFYSVRPVTRSLSNNSNSSSSDGEGGSSNSLNQQKLSPRCSRTPLDNGFVVPSSPPVTVRRSRSTTYVKMSERFAIGRSELTIRGHNIRDVASGESLTIKQVFKRRPGTPLPTSEQLARVSRANIDSMYMQSPRSLPPIPKLKPIRKAAALPPPPPLQPAPSRLLEQQRQQVSSEMTEGTDTNGNSLDAEFETSSNEKPQRTAKVVAILSLESKSGSRLNSSSSNQQSLSPSQRARHFNSENSAINHVRSPRSSRAINVNKTSTTSSREDNNSSETITMIDLDDDSESECVEPVVNDLQRIGQRVTRTRLSTQLCTKSSMNIFNKSSSGKEIQMIEIDDDEDDRIPLKKSRSSALPLASTGTADKLSNSNPAS